MVLIDYHNPPESASDIAALVGREKFQDNGGCGYVLKPSYLVTKGVLPFPPSSLSVHLLSAQWIPEFPMQVASFSLPFRFCPTASYLFNFWNRRMGPPQALL
jgi:hypothetical protein